MTNPDNHIEIPTPFPSDSITAIAYYKPNISKFILNGNLWIGTKNGSLHIAEEVIESRTSFIFRSTMRTARKNFIVKEIIPIYEDPPCTLVHWMGGNGQAGPVQVIYPGGVRVQIFEEANRILYTTVNKAKAKNSENRSLIGILHGESITFFEFIGDMVVEKNKIEKLSDGFIEAIEMGEESIIYFSKGCYHKYDLYNLTDTRISTSTIGELKNKINPFVVKVAPETFIIAYKEFMMIIGLNTKEREAMIHYDKNNKVPHRILIFKDIMYQFYDNLFTRQPIIPLQTGSDPQVFNFQSVFLSCMVGDNLIIVTPKSVQMIGTIPQPPDLANKIIEKGGVYDEFENLMNKLSKEQVSEIISDIFDIIWKNGKYELAFDLISTHLILNNINKYVSLMPILIIDAPDENAINSSNMNNQQTYFDIDQIYIQKRNYIISPDVKPLEENDKRYLNKMLDFLSFTRSMYIQNICKYKDSIHVVNTALAQCYAAFSKTRELDELIVENHLDLRPLQYFIRERSKILSLNPSYAILQSNIGEVDEAVLIWQKLDLALAKSNKFNPMFVTEASYAVQKLRDSSNLISYLNWIFEKDPNSPELAINAILSINHDPTEINSWMSSKGLDNYKLRYCVYIVTQSNSNTNSRNSFNVSSAGKASTLANETFISLLDILSEIDNSDFDLNRLQFTKSSKDGTAGGVFKLNAKKEIFQYLMKILELHAGSINESDAENHITDNIDINIKLALYRVKRMYEKGIKLMLQKSANSEFPEEKVQEFCRLAPEPDAAFSVLINIIDPKDLIPKFKNFILDNLTYMNIPELITHIPKNLKMSEVQLILKKSYNILQSRINNLNNQIAVAKSIKVDTLYRKTQVQANYCYLRKDVRCAKCGNKILEEQQCVMAPGGTSMPVYHPRCKPILFT